VIDEAALVRACKVAGVLPCRSCSLADSAGSQEGWIAGAALDVFEREPELAPGLADLPNVVIVPHIGRCACCPLWHAPLPADL
jgi:hypothetical protein